jgi:hypothetical protein
VSPVNVTAELGIGARLTFPSSCWWAVVRSSLLSPPVFARSDATRTRPWSETHCAAILADKAPRTRAHTAWGLAGRRLGQSAVGSAQERRTDAGGTLGLGKSRTARHT